MTDEKSSLYQVHLQYLQDVGRLLMNTQIETEYNRLLNQYLTGISGSKTTKPMMAPFVPPCCQLVCPNCFVRWTHTDKLIRVRCVERRKKEPHRIRQTVSCRRCKARLIIKGYATSDYTDFQLKPANSITVKGDSTIVVNSRKLKKKKRKERIALYKQETSGSSKNQKKAKPALHGFLSLLIMIPQAKSALRQRMRTVLRSIPASVILEKSEQIVNQVLDTKEFQNSNSLCAYLNMPSEPVTEQLVRQALSLNKKLYIPQVIPKSHSTSSLTTMRMCRLRSVEELDQWTSNVWGIKEPPLDAQRLTDEAIEDVATFLNRTAGSSVVPMYSRLSVDIQTPEVGKRIFCNGFHVNRCTFEVVQGGVDLIIVPGLAFTSNGHRLGRGGGYYDRYLNWYRRVATERNIKFPVLIAMAFREQLVNEIPIEQHDNTMDRLFSD